MFIISVENFDYYKYDYNNRKNTISLYSKNSEYKYVAHLRKSSRMIVRPKQLFLDNYL